MKITVFKPLVVRRADYIIFVEYAEGRSDLFFLGPGRGSGGILQDNRDYDMHYDIMFRPEEVLGIKYAEEFFPTNGKTCIIIPIETLLTAKQHNYRSFAKNLLLYREERK